MLKDSQVDLCGRTDFTRTAPLLARDEAFSFACAGCGGCCRGGRISCCRALTCGASRPACACRPAPWPGRSAGGASGGSAACRCCGWPR